MAKTDAAAELYEQLRLASDAPIASREYRFAREIVGEEPGIRARLKEAGLKDWRFDLAWPVLRVAVEVDGGGWVQGRHSRGAGIEDDCHKLSTAVSWGWRVLRVTPTQVRDGRALQWIERTLKGAK